MLTAAPGDPTLLTAEEAATIARCSIKTVRRAYGNGVLVAYRRRGSRAVLLDKRDVLDWVQGEVMDAGVDSSRSPERSDDPPHARENAGRTSGRPRATQQNSQRFDVSSDALRARRRARSE